MPILKQKNLLFIHIPKTGGQTVLNYFNFFQKNKNNCGKSNNYNGRSNDVIKKNEDGYSKTICGTEYGHFTLRLLKKYVNLREFNFSFSFVRNPFDKLVSEFFWRLKYKISFKPLLNFEPKDNNFELFINKLEELKLTYLENMTAVESHFYPQTKFVFLRKYFLKNKKNNKVDFVGRFENYENDLKILGSIFGIKKEIIHKNKSDHPNYKTLYSYSSRKIVEKIYKDDLNNFNYVF